MNGLFANFKNEDELELEKDSVGKTLHPTDIYKTTVKMAYIDKSDKGTLYAVICLLIGKEEYKQLINISNRKGENFYTKDGKTYKLPGYSIVNSLVALITNGEDSLETSTIATKVVKVYDKDLKTEVNKDVNALVNILNKDIYVALGHIKKNKQELNQKTGEYEDVADSIEVNDIIKFLHIDTQNTYTELREGKEEATFAKTWLEKNQGKVIDRYKPVTGTSNSKTTSIAPKKATGSLFPVRQQ